MSVCDKQEYMSIQSPAVVQHEISTDQYFNTGLEPLHPVEITQDDRKGSGPYHLGFNVSRGTQFVATYSLSLIVLIFSCYMIARDDDNSQVALWSSIITSIAAQYVPSPMSLAAESTPRIHRR